MSRLTQPHEGRHRALHRLTVVAMALALALSAEPAGAQGAGTRPQNDPNEKHLDGGTSRVTQINLERVESPTAALEYARRLERSVRI